MATPAVGEDIEALCGRCGQVWHVVMAKMGDRIAKVVCKRCGGHHLYRTETGADLPSVGGPSSGGRTTRRTSRRTTREVAVAPLPAFDPATPPRPYSPKESFAPGQRISHPSFGVGVVAGAPGPGKVEIAFPTGRRVLASAKAASTLERPTPGRHAATADLPPDKPQ
jgi:hypothetical protein